jgi:hypothetical protein
MVGSDGGCARRSAPEGPFVAIDEAGQKRWVFCGCSAASDLAQCCERSLSPRSPQERAGEGDPGGAVPNRSTVKGLLRDPSSAGRLLPAEKGSGLADCGGHPDAGEPVGDHRSARQRLESLSDWASGRASLADKQLCAARFRAVPLCLLSQTPETDCSGRTFLAPARIDQLPE